MLSNYKNISIIRSVHSNKIKQPKLGELKHVHGTDYNIAEWRLP